MRATNWRVPFGTASLCPLVIRQIRLWVWVCLRCCVHCEMPQPAARPAIAVLHYTLDPHPTMLQTATSRERWQLLLQLPAVALALAFT